MVLLSKEEGKIRKNIRASADHYKNEQRKDNPENKQVGYLQRVEKWSSRGKEGAVFLSMPF